MKRLSTIIKLIELLVIIATCFGWIAMISVGVVSESYELLRYNPLRYGFLILLFSTPTFVIISSRKMLCEWLSIGMIIFGMFSLCQPFTIFLYRCGFQTLLVGTLAFIIASHRKQWGEKTYLPRRMG